MMVRADELQSLNPAAWTALLDRRPDVRGTIVTAVEKECIGGGCDLVRYLLSLEGYLEPTTLIGKKTNVSEALFYRDIAPTLPFKTPQCWFSYVADGKSWVVLDEIHNDHPRVQWTSDDVERIILHMSQLHSAFWNQHQFLRQVGFEPRLAEVEDNAFGAGSQTSGQARLGPALQRKAGQSRIDEWMADNHVSVSKHAIRSAGRLAPDLIRAAKGLEVMRAIGGWPGVVEEAHMAAAADLLDDPLPMLYTLRQLPVTLVHGNPGAAKWYVTLFDDYYLLDWNQAAIGPGIYDLVTFIEQFDMVEETAGPWRTNVRWPATEETMEDSYILAMGRYLGSHFNARAQRLAIPAARCLYVLTHWFPRIAGWFQQEQPHLDVGQSPNGTITAELGALRPHLSRVFDRFAVACQAL